MLVSIVIPAYRAQDTLAETVRSVMAQAFTNWECIVVSDDGADYGAILRDSGIADRRVCYVSTGEVGSGCHAARNRGLRECRGEMVCALDADDVWLPRRLEVLVPQAERYGASVDGPRVIQTGDCSVLYAAFEGYASPFMLGVSQLLRLTCPLFPLTRRELTFPRTAGIEHLEDVVSNLLLISSNGPIWATPETLMDYRVLPGSMCHGNDSASQFDRAYADIIARVSSEALPVSAELRPEVLAGLERKRALNRQFNSARHQTSDLNFQTFAAAQSRSRHT